MTHTFLFEPGVWTASGTFWRGDGEPMQAQGRTEIAHRADCWLLSGTLKVLGSPPVEFVNAYCIEPPGRQPAAMKWTSENATLGKLHGTFSIIGSSIFCVYRCQDSSTWSSSIPTVIAVQEFSFSKIAPYRRGR
jgi:hypothetical protein